MVYRIFVEKKDGFNNEAKSLYSDITEFLGIKRLNKLRIFNRYDAENISEKIFDYAIKTVFSEPQLDNVYKELNINKAFIFATEYLPGQFDQRAESASQCIQIISQGKKPLIKTAKVYALYGNLTKKDIEEIKKYIINPVEMREANFLKPGTLKEKYKIPKTVKMIVSDFDGIFTDNTIIISEDKKISRRISFKDVMGVSLLVKNGYQVGIISGEKNSAIELISETFKLKEVHQGIRNKIEVLNGILERNNLTPEEVLYVGDDVNDAECLKLAGTKYTVPNANKKIKTIENIQVTSVCGGDGAFREIADEILDVE